MSDFADGTCLRAMALAYDSCFDLLTPQEKNELEGAIAARAGRMFSRWRNNLETRIFSAHIWQHILHEFAEAAFATLGEIEEAELWAAYVYELWLARVPLLGGEDGGWANGNNYFGTNFVTLISIPTFFEQLTGADFFAHPWYRNSIYYMIYTWPPGFDPDGFGDGWYIHSRGHNTVLIDNKGQLTSTPDGYGQIIRYLHDDAITYCLGDASNAYGDAGLTLFRRHVALLRPSTLVIYDELEADHPAQWSWLLHCGNRISADAANNRLEAVTSTARSRVDFFASTALNLDVHNRFDPPALNWRKRTSGGKLVEYPDQWHAAVSPTAKTAKMRYLAVVQVVDRDDGSSLVSSEMLDDNTVRVGSWSIAAGLGPARPATLEIRSSDRQAVLLVNRDSVETAD